MQAEIADVQTAGGQAEQNEMRAEMRPIVRGRTRQAGRLRWRMRAGAWVTSLSTLGLFALARPAQAEQLHRQIEASKPHVRHVNELKPGTTDKLTPAQWKAVDAKRAQEQAAKIARQPDVRALTPAEMKAAKGSGPYRNAYYAGTLPWHRSLRDVNLCNGNLFKSFTDIQVAPGKGAGLALQRTYNSQDARPGPFGVGWTHAYDIRMEEENPTTNTSSDALNVADRTDFFGGKHKYHRDCDGLYSPPPYLFDETSSDYQQFLVNGPVTPLDDTEIGMDGTTKHFVKVADNVRACDYIQDRYGNRTNLVYGAVVNGSAVSNLLASVTDPTGRQLLFTWANLGTAAQPIYRITGVTGPQYSVAYSYNGDANLSSVTLDAGDATHLNRTTTYGYATVAGESGLLSSISDSLGHAVSYTYTLPATGYTGTLWPTTLTEPSSNAGQAATLSWTIQPAATYGAVPFGVTAQSSAGQQVKAATDTQLRKRWLALSGPYMHVSYYDSANNVTHQVSPGGRLILPTNYYANAGGSEQYVTYGPHGNVLTSSFYSDPSQPHVSTAYYNGSQYFQKKSVTDENGHVTTFGVGTKTAGTAGDPDTNPGDKGSVLWVKDAKYGDGTLNNTGTRFSYAYNAAGQKTQEVNQSGTVTNYTYGDTWGNLTSVVQDPNPSGQTTHLVRQTSMTYDIAGHVLTSTDPKAQQSSFSYNALGQPTSAAFPATANTSSETVSYLYGANGRTSSVTDNRGTTTLAYENGSDRVASVSDPITGSLGYTYGLSGERQTLSLPGGGTWTYGYGTQDIKSLLPKDDPNSVSPALVNITDDQGRRVDMWLSEAGRPFETWQNQAFVGANQVSYQDTTYAYETAHQWLTQLSNTFTWKDASQQWHSKLLVGNAYTQDNAGQRLTNTLSSLDGTGQPTSRTEQYGYDELNRLTSVDYGDGQTQSYAFDSMGNRTSKTDAGGGLNGSESYSYNAANMLLSRASSNYTNDANGNTLSGGGRVNTWDCQNRLATCSFNNNTSSFTYGSDGLRHRSVVNGTSTDFVLDASMFVREMHNGTVTATYFMGGSGPAYKRDDANGGSVRWYLYDGLGSVLGEVDPQGNITARRKYDVYGLARGVTGTPSSKHAFVGSLGHSSEEETNLVYMRARYMDPQTGRFFSQDPATHDRNWYIYAADNPVSAVDITGREWSLAGQGVVVGFAAGFSSTMFFELLTTGTCSLSDCFWAGITGAIMGGMAGALAPAGSAAKIARLMSGLTNGTAGASGHQVGMYVLGALGLGSCGGGLAGVLRDLFGYAVMLTSALEWGSEHMGDGCGTTNSDPSKCHGLPQNF